MSFDKVKSYFEKAGLSDRVLLLNDTSATVELAAKAIGCEPERIAKTLSFSRGDGAFVVVFAGDARIDNKKFKDYFKVKAKMLKRDEVKVLVGHEPGGVCPFEIKENTLVYLDISLKRFDLVYPAAGSANSAVKLTPKELWSHSGAVAWVDVAKDWT